MRILIAEDDSILADGLVRSLRQSGYAVDHVRHGVDADNALSLQTFDLLILDLQPALYFFAVWRAVQIGAGQRDSCQTIA